MLIGRYAEHDVHVKFSKYPDPIPLELIVGVRLIAGNAWEPVCVCVMLSGMAVEPDAELIPTSISPVPVAADNSLNAVAVSEFEVSADCTVHV